MAANVSPRHRKYVTPDRTIVAALVCRGASLALFRRSSLVAHDKNLWHCLTGYLDRDTCPLTQVLSELREEIGIKESDIQRLYHGPIVRIPDTSQHLWIAYTFGVVLNDKAMIRLNWENQSYKWVDPTSSCLKRMDTVPWLVTVLEALPISELVSCEIVGFGECTRESTMSLSRR